MSATVKEYSINDLEEVLLSIRKAYPKLTEEDICKSLNYNEGYISQCRSRGKVSKRFVDNLKLKYTLQNATQQNEAPPDYEKKYHALLEKIVERDELVRKMEHIVVSNANNLKQITERLYAVEQKLLFVAAFQKEYQDYYADHIPPAGVSSEDMKKEIWNKALRRMVQFREEGIE